MVTLDLPSPISSSFYSLLPSFSRYEADSSESKCTSQSVSLDAHLHYQYRPSIPKRSRYYSERGSVVFRITRTPPRHFPALVYSTFIYLDHHLSIRLCTYDVRPVIFAKPTYWRSSERMFSCTRGSCGIRCGLKSDTRDPSEAGLGSGMIPSVQAR